MHRPFPTLFVFAVVISTSAKAEPASEATSACSVMELRTFLLSVQAQLTGGEKPVEVRPGAKPPREVLVKMEPLVGRLRRALTRQDQKGVTTACNDLVRTLGPWAGNPETAPRYFHPIDRTEPEIEAVWELWREIERRTRRSIAWLAVPDADPRKMRTGLRAAGRPILAYLTLARVQPERRDEHLTLARDGADYLLEVQRNDGLIPFPDLRGRHPLFGPMLDKLLRRHPDAMVGGWTVDDGGDGSLKYDNAICGVALIETYEATREQIYLDAARRTCEWAASRPLCSNWNYNAFSVLRRLTVNGRSIPALTVH